MSFRHWVSKHFQDFEQDVNLRSQAIVFLEDITCSPNLLPSEHRAASQLLRLLVRDDLDSGRQQLENLLSQPLVSKECYLFEKRCTISFPKYYRLQVKTV